MCRCGCINYITFVIKVIKYAYNKQIIIKLCDNKATLNEQKDSIKM